MKRPEVIEKIKEIIKKFPVQATVILFGSEARGEARPDSDIDLLILVDDEQFAKAKTNELTVPLYDVELETGVLINYIIMLKNQWGKIKTPLYENIQKDGIILSA